MKRRFSIAAYGILLAAFASMLMGMSGVGTGSAGTQSNVLLPFNAKVTDTENNTVELSSVVIDGKTSFQAGMGKGKVTIPFDRISRIDIKGKSACVTMSDNRTLCDLKIKEVSKVCGNTSFGIYQIPLSDVVSIQFPKAR